MIWLHQKHFIIATNGFPFEKYTDATHLCQACGFNNLRLAIIETAGGI